MNIQVEWQTKLYVKGKKKHIVNTKIFHIFIQNSFVINFPLQKFAHPKSKGGRCRKLHVSHFIT